MVIRSFAARLL